MESEIGEPGDLVPAGNQNGPVITGQRGKPGGGSLSGIIFFSGHIKFNFPIQIKSLGEITKKMLTNRIGRIIDRMIVVNYFSGSKQFITTCLMKIVQLYYRFI